MFIKCEKYIELHWELGPHHQEQHRREEESSLTRLLCIILLDFHWLHLFFCDLPDCRKLSGTTKLQEKNR